MFNRKKKPNKYTKEQTKAWMEQDPILGEIIRLHKQGKTDKEIIELMKKKIKPIDWLVTQTELILRKVLTDE